MDFELSSKIYSDNYFPYNFALQLLAHCKAQRRIHLLPTVLVMRNIMLTPHVVTHLNKFVYLQ